MLFAAAGLAVRPERHTFLFGIRRKLHVGVAELVTHCVHKRPFFPLPTNGR